MFYSIHYPEYFELRREQDDDFCYGCDQAWYGSEWQRIAGCGPTVASNIIFYFSKTRPNACKPAVKNEKAACLDLMEAVWSFVTPTEWGVNTTKLFYDSLGAYFDAIGTHAVAQVCDIPENRDERPALREVRDFLIGAMQSDAPVAFLNLCNGEEMDLDEWHWVTLVSMRSSESSDQMQGMILDEGQFKEIDLGLWYATTELGGGFVYFKIPDAAPGPSEQESGRI